MGMLLQMKLMPALLQEYRNDWWKRPWNRHEYYNSQSYDGQVVSYISITTVYMYKYELYQNSDVLLLCLIPCHHYNIQNELVQAVQVEILQNYYAEVEHLLTIFSDISIFKQ
jgi:hypothetical protein